MLSPACAVRAAVAKPANTATTAPSTAATADSIYDIYFHGPSYQVLADAWMEGDVMVGASAANLPPDHQPADSSLLSWPPLQA